MCSSDLPHLACNFLKIRRHRPRVVVTSVAISGTHRRQPSIRLVPLPRHVLVPRPWRVGMREDPGTWGGTAWDGRWVTPKPRGPKKSKPRTSISACSTFTPFSQLTIGVATCLCVESPVACKPPTNTSHSGWCVPLVSIPPAATFTPLFQPWLRQHRLFHPFSPPYACS